MCYMFSELEEIDLYNFNTSKIKDMNGMFRNCEKLKRIIGIEKFNTNEVINMSEMFKVCKELEELDISNFNTSKVTDMEEMFSNCAKLKKIKGIEKFNMNKINNKRDMCKNLK